MNRHRRALQLVAEARPAVLDDAPDRPVPLFPDLPAPVPSVSRPRRRLILAGLVPTVTAGVLAGALLVSLPNSTPRPPGAPSAQPVTAQGILLAAAEKTAAQAPATGDFWVTKTELRHLYDVGDYTVLGRSEVETWHALRTGGHDVIVTRWLGASPATDADRTAWKVAGSPTTWTVSGPAGNPGRSLQSAPGTRNVAITPTGGFELAGKQLTYAEIQALPSDPDTLKAYLVKADQEARGTWQPDDPAAWRVELLFGHARSLLADLPVSPQVRAATYRMLAGLPGLTVTENVRDAHGRAGAAISHTIRNDGGDSFELSLVIDPQSGALLAVEERSVNTLMLGQRFTDAAPPRS